MRLSQRSWLEAKYKNRGWLKILESVLPKRKNIYHENEIERRFSDYDVSLYKRERERTFEDNVHCFANSRMNSPVQKREDEASHITK